MLSSGVDTDIIYWRSNVLFVLSARFECQVLYDSLAQLAEHLTFNQGVRGSNPRWLTKPVPLEWGLGGIAQLVRVPASHAGGHRFEPCCLHQNATSKRPLLWAFGVAFYLFSYYNRNKNGMISNSTGCTLGVRRKHIMEYWIYL